MKFVEFSTKVPEKEYQAFKAAFPQYGAVGWFINAALKRFNEEVRKNPTGVEAMRKTISDIATQSTAETEQSA